MNETNKSLIRQALDKAQHWTHNSGGPPLSDYLSALKVIEIVASPLFATDDHKDWGRLQDALNTWADEVLNGY